MSRELAFVLVNPYTISKSRTGGVIARYTARTDLAFTGARMFGPSSELVERYAESVAQNDIDGVGTCRLLAEYIRTHFSPDPVTGRRRRVLMLLFEGDDAVQKIWNVTGSSTLKSGSGQTIRDTYGDYIVDADGRVKYFEPAVLVGATRRRAMSTLRLWAEYSARDGGIVDAAADVPKGENVEKTLVLLKPDNFHVPSARPGNIIDALSSSGLRIVGAKKFCMKVAQGEKFYGPVRDSLRSKFRDIGMKRVDRSLAEEFGFPIPEDRLHKVCDEIAPLFADHEFENIIRFMTGYRPSDCSPHEKLVLGSEDCLALVYEGVDAVRKIRAIVGITDPSKAKPGSIRREFGKDIMVNAAHASDSHDNAIREINIIDVAEDTVKPLVDKYYGNLLLRARAWHRAWPRLRCKIVRVIRGQWPASAAPVNG